MECLKNHIFNSIGKGKVADIGAGTGKLTENLVEIGLEGFAVEPNDAMRREAGKILWGEKFLWSEGYAEATWT